MRVLHVARPAAGGMVTHLRLLCGGLGDLGLKVAIAAPAGLSLDLPDVPIHVVPIRSRPSPVFDLAAARGASRAASAADLIHGHGLRGAWIASLASRLARKPFLFTAHNLSPRQMDPLSRTLVRHVIGRAARVLCVSRAVAESFTPYGLADSKSVVIPNGIDLEPFESPRSREEVRAELGIPAGAPLIVSVGRLSEEKGFRILVRAARIVLQEMPDRRPDSWFVLAGEGPDRGSLESWIHKLEIESRFKLLGRYNDIPALLSASDLVVVPSVEEGQGIVALEAMAARRPVVATRAGGLAETIVPNETGTLVVVGSPSQLGVGILDLLADSALRRRLGEAGRARVEAYYTAGGMVEQTVLLYRELRGLKNL